MLRWKKMMLKALLNHTAMPKKLYPENIEIKYWYAIALANAKMIDRSLPVFKKIFEEDENWLILTKRLPAVGLLNVTDEELQKIITQKE